MSLWVVDSVGRYAVRLASEIEHDSIHDWLRTHVGSEPVSSHRLNSRGGVPSLKYNEFKSTCHTSEGLRNCDGSIAALSNTDGYIESSRSVFAVLIIRRG